jgi:hypothetical protein
VSPVLTAVNFFTFDAAVEPSILEVHVYTATEYTGAPTASEEMHPIAWFPTTSLPFGQMWPDDAIWLQPVLSGRHLCAHFAFSDLSTMVSIQVRTLDGAPLPPPAVVPVDTSLVAASDSYDWVPPAAGTAEEAPDAAHQVQSSVASEESPFGSLLALREALVSESLIPLVLERHKSSIGDLPPLGRGAFSAARCLALC